MKSKNCIGKKMKLEKELRSQCAATFKCRLYLSVELRVLLEILNGDSSSSRHLAARLVRVQTLYKPLPFRLALVPYSLSSDLFLN